MTDQNLLDAYHQLGRLSSSALDEEKFHEALQYAIAAHLITRDTERGGINDSILVLIWKACESLLALRSEVSVKRAREERKEKQVCSFCGKKEPDVKLVPGPHRVFICSSCVTGFYNGFKKT